MPARRNFVLPIGAALHLQIIIAACGLAAFGLMLCYLRSSPCSWCEWIDGHGGDEPSDVEPRQAED